MLQKIKMVTFDVGITAELGALLSQGDCGWVTVRSWVGGIVLALVLWAGIVFPTLIGLSLSGLESRQGSVHSVCDRLQRISIF